MSTSADNTKSEILLAAELINAADALIVTAGAGMGVDSGLPDFRSNEGFWRNYQGQRPQESTFEKIARPSTFVENLDFAWAFYGHRQRLYRDTNPHPGFSTLLSWCKAMSAGYFVYTSNVDGHFQKAGFRSDGLFECHGNIFWLQCLKPCSRDIWIAEEPAAQGGPYPHCPNCGGAARPNVLMFADFGCVSDLADQQYAAYKAWLKHVSGKRLTIIELGAGSTIPTVRRESEQLAANHDGTLVRINPGEPNGPPGTVEISLPALEAIEQIHAVLPEGFQQRAIDSQRQESAASTRGSSEKFDMLAKKNPGAVITTAPGTLKTRKTQKAYSKAFQIELPSGYVAWINHFDITRTYLGYIEGLPNAADVQQEINKARKFVAANFFGPEPVVLAPKLFDEKSENPIMPPLRFSAQIMCWEATDVDSDGSWMNLIWFAEIDDNKSIKDFIAEALAQVDWPTQATSYLI